MSSKFLAYGKTVALNCFSSVNAGSKISQKSTKIIESGWRIIVSKRYIIPISPKHIQLMCKQQLKCVEPPFKHREIIMLLTTKMTETHIKAIVTYKIFSVFPVAAFRASLTSISYPLNYSTYSSTAPVYYFN